MGQRSEHQNKDTKVNQYQRNHDKYRHIFFSEASINGVCAVAYAVIHQPNNIRQGLIISKSRLAKRNLTIPRLELIAAKMSPNLAQNIKNVLNNQNVRNVYAWSDSTVALNWLKYKGEYKAIW